MQINPVNLNKDIHNFNSEIKRSVVEYEVLFLVNEISKMEESDPKNVNKDFYQKPSLVDFLVSKLPKSRQKEEFVSSLMEKYTLLGKTSDDEILKPEDLYYENKNGEKIHRKDDEINMLMNDFLQTAEEQAKHSTVNRFEAIDTGTLSVKERLEHRGRQLDKFDIVEMNGSLKYMYIPKENESFNKFKNDVEKRRAIARRPS